MTRRRAVITGAGSGLGQATTHVLAAAGHDCLVVGRTEEKLDVTSQQIADAGGRAESCVADVTEPADRQHVINECKRLFGGIDILVNAATVTAMEPLLDYREESWREVLAVNLSACFFLAQAAIEDMRPRGWGRIVNIGSVYGMVVLDNQVYREVLAIDAGGRGPVREVAYAAAKGGVRQLTRELAVSCARWGITVNTVVPGMFPAHRGPMPDAMRDRLLERIPLGRFGNAEEIGYAVEFLASERASYVTGSEVVVDGGWTAW